MTLAPEVDMTIALAATALAVLIFVFVGMAMGARMWAQYQQRYIEGAATTLDAMYINLPPQSIFYISFLCVLIIGMVMTVVTGSPVAGGIFGLPAFFLPKFALWYLKKRRDTLFNLQLIDALMNVSNSLRAGFTLPQAFELLAREMPDPMSQEMRLVCQELRLGVTINDALENLYRRMPLQDVDLLVTSVSISQDVGGNMTEIFDNIAQTIRERLRIEGKLRALTAQGKAQAFVICMMPFLIAAGLMVVSPHLFTILYTKPLGWALIAVVLIMEALGGYFVYKITNIDV